MVWYVLEYHFWYVPWYTCTYMCTRVYNYLKNDLKYKHSGATGTLLVGVVSIEGITVYYSTIWYVLEYHFYMVRTMVHVYSSVQLSQKRLEIQALRCNGDTS